MLEKPDLQDEKIINILQDAYKLTAVQVTFLPLGADLNTAVYRVVADDKTAYFLKLRGGIFDETSVALPKFLSEHGIAHIIAPLVAQTGQLWASLEACKVILYPFVQGRNGYEVALTQYQWIDFGRTLKRIHAVEVPPVLLGRVQQETYSPYGRETIKKYLRRLDEDSFGDPTAVELAAFLKARREEILDLVGRAEGYAQALQAQPPEFILCHSDLHAGNLLIDAQGAFYIVDWDDPILAPKERDLMFIGGAQGFIGHTPQEEENLFYQGYGQAQIHPIAMAYYRYERIVQDIAIFCEQIFLTNEGGEDREQALQYLKSNFLPGDTIEIAYRSDANLKNR